MCIRCLHVHTRYCEDFHAIFCCSSPGNHVFQLKISSPIAYFYHRDPGRLTLGWPFRFFVTPSDSVAIIAANSVDSIPYFYDGLKGVARYRNSVSSM
jgi:hypothetical protein